MARQFHSHWFSASIQFASHWRFTLQLFPTRGRSFSHPSRICSGSTSFKLTFFGCVTNLFLNLYRICFFLCFYFHPGSPACAWREDHHKDSQALLCRDFSPLHKQTMFGVSWNPLWYNNPLHALRAPTLIFQYALTFPGILAAFINLTQIYVCMRKLQLYRLLGLLNSFHIQHQFVAFDLWQHRHFDRIIKQIKIIKSPWKQFEIATTF